MPHDKEQVRAAVVSDPEAFYSQFLDLRAEGANWKALCPLHAEGNGSLTVWANGGWHCFGCHKGGDAFAFVQAVENCSFTEALRKVADRCGVREEVQTVESSSSAKRMELPPRRPERVYSVVSDQGETLAYHLRWELPTGKKETIAWAHPDEAKRGDKSLPPGMARGLNKLRQKSLPLYNLPALLQAGEGALVVVTEGEADCSALTGAGVLAVGTYGSETLPDDDCLRPLLGMNVLLWPDADDVGAAHMEAVAGRLTALGGCAYRVEWEGAPAKGGAADFLATETPEALQDLLATAKPYASPEPSKPEPARARTAQEVLDSSRATSWLWYGYRVNGHINITAAPGDSGKSLCELSITKTITTGCDWPDGTPYTGEVGNVLWLDFEGMQVATAERALAMGIPLDRLFMPPDGPLPYLSRFGAFDAIRRLIDETNALYVVCDSWRRATPGLVEKDSDGAVEIGMELDTIASDFGIPFNVVAHTRKVREGQRWEVSLDDVRGTSALTDMARCVSVIEKPSASSDTRRLRVEKSNMAAKPEPLGFDLVPVTPEADACNVVWTAAPHSEAIMPQRTAAQEAIQIALQAGPLRYSELEASLRERGISEATLRRAIKSVAIKTPDGRWSLVSMAA
ncbi:MAG: AAA family ATPase [Armatimonadia bacterium]